MEVIIKDTYKELSDMAAMLVGQNLRHKQDAVLGLATGSTPLGLYRELTRMHREEGLDFSQVTTFNLDEYVGLPASHPQSYNYFMTENLFRHINIRNKNTFIPSGVAKNIAAYCKQYEQRIRDVGGIDLQILGIGSDGHIGFNEPGSSLSSRTRIKTLAQRTIHDNARFFKRLEDVPVNAITMGVGTILEARKIILLASGENKSRAVATAIEGPVSRACTASALQMHQGVTILLDQAAASKLKLLGPVK